MPECFLSQWVVESEPDPSHQNVRLLVERHNARETAMASICEAVTDHLVGAMVLERLGYPKAAEVVRRNLPVSKKIRSGDLAEILGMEYVGRRTDFQVPIKRLRYKDDRDLPMRGDDIVGLAQVGGRTRLLKGEVKSRASLGRQTVGEACDALAKNDSRPNPDTLAFIARMLRLEGRDGQAAAIENLQTHQFGYNDIAHLIFTLSGNDPTTALTAHANNQSPVSDRRLVGLQVNDHQQFVNEVFDRLAVSSTTDVATDVFGGDAVPAATPVNLG